MDLEDEISLINRGIIHLKSVLEFLKSFEKVLAKIDSANDSGADSIDIKYFIKKVSEAWRE